MKIAYIFVGHFRTWEKCYQNFFNNIYNVVPGDIFIDTWNKTNCSTTSWWNNWDGELDEQSKNISQQTPDFKQIVEIYKPNIITINNDPSWLPEDKFWAYNSKYKNSDAYKHSRSKSKLAIKYVLQSLHNMFNIAIKTNNYDRIFCLRPDIDFTSTINLEELKLPGFVTSSSRYNTAKYTQDIFYHSSPEIIKIKTEFVNHVDTYWYDKDYTTIDFEAALNEYLSDNKVPIINSSLLFNIPRINNCRSTFN
jgi:hypothetical protein